MRAVSTLAVITGLAACAPQRTAGDELFGAWAQVDVAPGTGQQWNLRDDLTFDRSGPVTSAGTFFVVGRTLTVEDFPPAASRVTSGYVATTSHWLEGAAFAVGDVRGRVGLWHGIFDDLSTQISRDVTLDLRPDGTAHEARFVSGPGLDEECQGDGTWSDSPTGSSFAVTLTVVCPSGTTTTSRRLWRLGDAIGVALHERISF